MMSPWVRLVAVGATLLVPGTQGHDAPGQMPSPHRPAFVFEGWKGAGFGSGTRGTGRRSRTWTGQALARKPRLTVPKTRFKEYKTGSGVLMVASPLGPDASPPRRKSEDFWDRFNVGIINALKGLMMAYYGKRTYARFYALETIARVPYFSYVSVLHLYETLGFWRKAEYLKIHFAESYNEMHHLLIMEELGGNDRFGDRWFAQHAAFFYFFIVVGLYMAHPKNAYNLNQHVEEHAFATYDAFVAREAEELKALPAPEVAKQYYGKDKLYLFNGLHNDQDGDESFEARDRDRPIMETLYDAFIALFQCENLSFIVVNCSPSLHRCVRVGCGQPDRVMALVRNDEWEHVKTMIALQKDENT